MHANSKSVLKQPRKKSIRESGALPCTAVLCCLVYGGGGCSCMLLLPPVLTSTDLRTLCPDLYTLHLWCFTTYNWTIRSNHLRRHATRMGTCIYLSEAAEAGDQCAVTHGNKSWCNVQQVTKIPALQLQITLCNLCAICHSPITV